MGLLFSFFDVRKVYQFSLIKLLQCGERSLMVSHQLGPLGCESSLKGGNRSLVFLHQLLQLVLELGDLVTCVSLEHADLLM